MSRKYRPHQCPTCDNFDKNYYCCPYLVGPTYVILRLKPSKRNCKDYRKGEKEEPKPFFIGLRQPY